MKNLDTLSPITSLMKILAIILNYKTAEMTLDSANAAIDALDYFTTDWQIEIVDNDSGDGSYDVIREAIESKGWDKVRVVESGHNGGFGAGNNFAMRPALDQDVQPDYIYILNSDAFPDTLAIKALFDYLKEHPKVGIAGSYIHGLEGDSHKTAFRFPSIIGELEDAVAFGLLTKLLKRHIISLEIPEQTTKVDWLAGVSMMFRSSMLKEVGLFDETFFLYYEETDLCKRAINIGWETVYVKESKVAHIGSVSTGMKQWQRLPSYWLDSRCHYFRKNHGRIYLGIATMVRLLGLMLNRIKLLIQRRKNTAPSHYILDMFKHWVRNF